MHKLKYTSNSLRQCKNKTFTTSKNEIENPSEKNSNLFTANAIDDNKTSDIKQSSTKEAKVLNDDVAEIKNKLSEALKNRPTSS